MTHQFGIRELRETFEKQGFVHPVPVIGSQLAQAYAERMQGSLAELAEEDRFADWTYYKPYLIFDWFYELATARALLDAVEQLLGPNILLWGGTIAMKEPRSRRFFSWHQDEKYWPLQPKGRAVVTWLALGEVNEQNGFVQFVPRSHKQGCIEHSMTYHPDNYLRRGQQVDAGFDLSTAEGVCLQPGEMSMHHGLTVHGSGGNQTDSPRLGIMMTYVPTEVQTPDSDESAILLRGKDTHGHFQQESFDPGFATAENRKLHREIMIRIKDRTLSAQGKQQAYGTSPQVP